MFGPFHATSCKNESNLLLVQITVCIESCLPIGWHTLLWKIRQNVALFWIGLLYVGILYSRAVIQRTIDVSPTFFEHSFAAKNAVWVHANTDPNKQVVGLIFAWSDWELCTLIKYWRSKIKNKKTSRIWCSFRGLSNGTTLMQIKYGRTVPLRLFTVHLQENKFKV